MAAFLPGSFTKNYGWRTHPPGLAKLHECIRRGFSGSATATSRDEFRKHARSLSPSAELVPPNFFLHNTIVGGKNYITQDELVRQALVAPHSSAFDQLALFALHLGRAGHRAGFGNGDADGAAFANDYVRNVLWQANGWNGAATGLDRIKARFNDTVEAKPGSVTVHKCATNYRFILEQAGLAKQLVSPLNSRWSDWIGSAGFLLFDRVSVDEFSGALPGAPDLIKAAKDAELHKLVGAGYDEVESIIEGVAHAYIADGGLARSIGFAPGSTSPVSSLAAAAPAKWSDEAARDEEYVKRRLREVRAQLRRPANVRELKALYVNACCFCGRRTPIGVDPERFYSEAAHIKPLGQPITVRIRSPTWCSFVQSITCSSIADFCVCDGSVEAVSRSKVVSTEIPSMAA